MPKIKELVVERWKEVRYIFEMFNHEWVFRGQRESAWPLSTPFKRMVYRLDYGNDPTDKKKLLKTLELSILKNFRARAHHYLTNLPDDTNYLEWFSLLIHHGAPSRFLNWTKSPYVASYFALENASRDLAETDSKEQYCAIFALNLKWCKERALEYIIDWIENNIDNNECDFINKFKNKLNIMTLEDAYMASSFFNDVIFSNSIKSLMPVEPIRLNERITIQQGILICIGDIKYNMEEILEKNYDEEYQNNFIKIVIPKNEWREGLIELNRMNINRATLFPGIDGFADYLDRTFAPLFLHEQSQVLDDLVQETDLSSFLKCDYKFYFSAPNTFGMLHKMTEPFSINDINIESIIQTQLSGEKQQWVFVAKLNEDQRPEVITSYFNSIEDIDCRAVKNK